MAMDDTLQLACAYTREGRYPEALGYFRGLVAYYEDEPGADVPAKLLSYYGLALALGENRVREGVTYCTRAIKKEFYHSDYYVNLARVHLKAGERSRAVTVLEKGLALDPNDSDIHGELRKLGVRRPPVLAFLDRGNRVNKYLGLFLAFIQGRRRSVEKSAR